MKSYRDYIWENGTPYGKSETEDLSGTTFRIIKDGYEKRISVEKYVDGVFDSTIYDSLLLDFRKLTPRDQKAWRKETLKETSDQLISLLRDIDDRVIHTEICTYNNERPIKAETYYGSKLLATSTLHYDGPFQGTILHDAEGKIVLKKRYHVENGDFTQLVD